MTTGPAAASGEGTDPGAAPGPDLTADDAADGADGADPGTGRFAILRAARRAFTQRPYAEVTMRGIAADAGVSASLIVKRFGTKERLFNTVADFGPAADRLFAAPPPELGRHLVLTIVRLRRENLSDPSSASSSPSATWTSGPCCGSASVSRSPPGWPVSSTGRGVS